MARDPADLRPPSHEAMSDADLEKPAELKEGHSLPDGTSDGRECDSLPTRPTTANAGEDAAVQHDTRQPNPLSVRSAPAHTLEAVRPRPDEKPAPDGLLRAVSESPRTLKTPRILRHACVSCTAGSGCLLLVIHCRASYDRWRIVIMSRLCTPFIAPETSQQLRC